MPTTRRKSTAKKVTPASAGKETTVEVTKKEIVSVREQAEIQVAESADEEFRAAWPAPTKGEFRGDFTRDIFDPARYYTGVLVQQGRVQLDADWNDQADILTNYLRALATDLIGPFGGPCVNAGFQIGKNPQSSVLDLLIGPGRYYVDGILCENRATVPYLKQPGYTPGENAVLPAPPFLVYLDVWERSISCNDDPDIREIALGGPDTTTRSQLVWQVKVWPPVNYPALYKTTPELLKWTEEWLSGMKQAKDCAQIRQQWNAIRSMVRPRSKCKLKAEAMKPADSVDSCTISPESRYRGENNQLYRVEIHDAGVAGTATFKWSRENSSVTFPIISLQGTSATLAHFGRDERTSLSPGTWVEIIDDDHVLREQPGDLVQIVSIDRATMTVTFTNTHVVLENYTGWNLHLRRWDQTTTGGQGAIPLTEGSYLDLENGVQVQFTEGGFYNTGDYWLIPARTVTGDVLWPYTDITKKDRLSLPPHGIAHHYAPLSVIACPTENEPVICDCRCHFIPHCGLETGRTISIDFISNKHVGDKFQATGSTNLPPGDQILITVYSSSFSPTQKSQTGEFSGASGTITVQKCGLWSFDLDISAFAPDTYVVDAAAVSNPDIRDTRTFKVT